ncbi:hypothetical protein BDA96_10G179100 [Sorghum bicolor]|uniref:Uncharacterized protein n=1 Tax=Sorghum bicolor TaxID=4558 RepID=A0A921U199_SORBI|nr:hypothetical protein BDA96_10G179100 [Sorghum bicolor]
MWPPKAIPWAATPCHTAAIENQQQTSTPPSPLLRFCQLSSPARYAAAAAPAPLRLPSPVSASQSPAFLSPSFLAATGTRQLPPPPPRSERLTVPALLPTPRSAGAPPLPRRGSANAAPVPPLLAGGDPLPGAPLRTACSL